MRRRTYAQRREWYRIRLASRFKVGRIFYHNMYQDIHYKCVQDDFDSGIVLEVISHPDESKVGAIKRFQWKGLDMLRDMPRNNKEAAKKLLKKEKAHA